MSDDNALELIKRGDRRFSKRSSLDSLRQEIALNFAPQHASWTTTLDLGTDFAGHLVDGTPLILASDYIGLIGSMLRPAGKQWFWHRTQDDRLNNIPKVREYLDWRSTQMMRIVFDRVTGADGALSETDEFYGLFGDAVLSIDYASPGREALTVQHFHSKDAVWLIGKDNRPDTITRRETLPARVIKARFSQKIDKLHPKIIEACEKDGDTEFEIRHEVLPADEYDAYVKRKDLRRREGWVSVWVDAANKHVIRETGQDTFRYVIPRAGRRYGYPYGISRATMIALPDARLIQQQAEAILEAAEKSINPPLIAYSDAIRGDIRLESLGVTYVDREYDTRTGDPLTPLELGKNFQLGVESLLRTEQQIARGFRLDRLRLPDTRRSKTREEAAFMIDEFVRSALPVFAPMKTEYNDEFLYECDRLVEAAGGYAGMDRPEEMGGSEIVFQWDNPLTDMLERQKAQKVAEVSMIAQTIAGIETAAAQIPALQQTDTAKMYRESVISVGAASWLIDEAESRKRIEAGSQQNMLRELVANAPGIADVIKSGTQAAQIASEIPNPAEPSYPMLPAPV